MSGAGQQQLAGLRPELTVPLHASAALATLADELREEGPVIAPHVAESDASPALGLLVAAGPRCAEAPAAYAAVIESVREGYLLHYGEPRLLAALDPDLRLLIGDHLYARGIERLVALGDTLAVRELSDVISLVGAARRRNDPVGGDPRGRLARRHRRDRDRSRPGPRGRQVDPSSRRLCATSVEGGGRRPPTATASPMPWPEPLRQ